MTSTLVLPANGTQPALSGRPKKIFRHPLAPYTGCKCGLCPWCLDQAKWESKFQKFIDPTYYSREAAPRMGSPLADLV